MSDRTFFLKPFPSQTPAPQIEISGSVDRQFNRLSIQYQILGQLAELAIPAVTDSPTRKDELWQQTCLEFFLGIEGSPQYWEFNLSPTGDWNIYYFEDYRQGMQPEAAFTSLPFVVHNRPNYLLLNLELNLDKVVEIEQKIEIAIASVVQSKAGEMTYWALTHCGTQADFHLRDSFAIEL
ncbi:DOMON-like domain-containing protein [Scytonema millei]|uniref:DOMON-like domain-containing protein n=1 Tax=Scytonema millei VB511283 TaxID=1245923 RepID=A0A9X5E8G7_9CYAN|nr:DOMON-like domain-containing protein [Scytonema millei]NHC36833.1 DOMON-like domain-containing protein [Scytonema millei VB511283]